MSRPGTPTTAGEVRSFMAAQMFTPVGTPARAHIDREFTPIIAELATLGPGNDLHPSVRKLFNWLVDPQHTVEEFNYVIGPLESHVYGIMMDQFDKYVYEESKGTCRYVGKVAAEALAARCPVLESTWEYAAWFMIRLNFGYSSEVYGFVSDKFCSWIINVIGDDDLCPNFLLRIELMRLYVVMVDLNDPNQVEALEKPVMFALSTLNLDYVVRDCHSQFLMNLKSIAYLVRRFQFDEKVADRYKQDIKTRLSIMFHDVTYKHSLTPSRQTESRDFYALYALLQTTSRHIQLEYNKFQDYGLPQCPSLINLKLTLETVQVLFRSFKICFQTPQLLDIAASCVIDFMELVLLVKVALIAHREDRYHHTMIIGMLKKLDGLIFSNYTIKYYICRYYKGRLRNIRDKCNVLKLGKYSTVSDVLENFEDI